MRVTRWTIHLRCSKVFLIYFSMRQSILPNSTILLRAASLTLRPSLRVEIRRKSNNSTARKFPKTRLWRFIDLIFPIWMIIRAMNIITSWVLRTKSCFVLVWVVSRFVPPVRVTTVKPILTGVLINSYCFTHIPVYTFLCSVCVQLRLSPKILPIMGVHTCVTHMGGINKRTPHCLIVEVIKINV